MPEEILIVAISGRALAQSAARTGCRVRVLDAFADRDTQALAETVCVAADGAIALDDEKLFAALDALDALRPAARHRRRQRLRALAADARPARRLRDAVRQRCRHRRGAQGSRALGGAAARARLASAGDPPRAAGRSARLAAEGDRRCRRRARAAGAAGECASRAPTISARFRGVRCPSPSSPTAQRAWVLGFNALAFRALGDAPFCYAGASTCSVDPALEREVQARLDRLVRVTGLRGLNGIDFLLDGSDVLRAGGQPAAHRDVRAVRPRLCAGPGGLARAQLRGTAAGFSRPVAHSAERPRARMRSCMRSTSCGSPTTPTSRAGAATCPRAAATHRSRARPVLSVFAEGAERGAGAAAPAAAGSRKCS